MLTVDKELAKRVVNEIDNLAEANENSKYTFTNFCKKHKLFHDNDKVLHNGNLFICCPFHKDESPSLGISEDRRVWNCLGCLKHGKFVDFVWNYTTEIEGREITWYQQVNELLKNDPELQMRVGASSIYKKEKPQDTFTGVSYRKFKLQSVKPKTYPELATYIKSHNFGKKEIIMALLQIQAGISPESIFDSMNNLKVSTPAQESEKDYDLTMMLDESDDATHETESPKQMNLED